MWKRQREVLTTSGTCPGSFVPQIFHNGQPSHGGNRKTFEVMTSTYPRGTLCSVAFLLAVTLYQGTTGYGISDQLRDAYSICRCCWNIATYKWKVHNSCTEGNNQILLMTFITWVLSYHELRILRMQTKATQKKLRALCNEVFEIGKLHKLPIKCQLDLSDKMIT